MTLTDAKIRNLKPKDKQYKVADLNGLHVLVRPNGSKLWRFKYRIHGKEKLLAIGVYPAVSLLEAREVRDRARSQISNGDDPSQLKREKALADKEIHNQSTAFDDPIPCGRTAAHVKRDQGRLFPVSRDGRHPRGIAPLQVGIAPSFWPETSRSSR